MADQQGIKALQANHLQKKILFTLAFLALYRVGVYIPIPGVDTQRLSQFFQQQGGNIFGMFNMFTGGALERFSVVALGVMPYISASIIMQLLTVVVPQLDQLQKEGESGRKKITQYTRYFTMILAVIQGFMIGSSLQGQSFSGGPLVMEGGGMGWLVMTSISLTAGTAFVMWLGEQITERGVGNGMSIIIFSGIIAGLPGVVANTYNQLNNSDIQLAQVILILGVIIATTAGVVFMEQAARQVPVQYAKRQVGNRMYGGQASHLPMRINSAGVIPAIFASSLIQFPATIAAFTRGNPVSDFLSTVFVPGGWLYNTTFASLIIFFAFFYTSITFKPDDIAENLKKNGGFIPGIRPGARTAEYLQKISARLTCIGSLYLALVCILPVILVERFNIPFYFGGTSLLIVVGVALETFRQIEAHRQSLRYDAFLKKGAIRPRRGFT